MGALLVVHVVRRDVARARWAEIDPARVVLDPGVDWMDPRWSEELAARMAQQAPFAPDDVEARSQLVAALEELSFVAEVADPTVLWPDGLELPLRLHQPVACVRVGDRFRPVADDGTLLAGLWPSPPPAGAIGGWLPVLGPIDRTFDTARAGTRVDGTPFLDALATARSMLASLDGEELGLLGRVVIDASRARAASVEEPGTRLLLEDSRVVFFGRAADTQEPGELPTWMKWRSLARALDLLGPGEPALDWDLVDVRWDEPELRPRGGFVEPHPELAPDPSEAPRDPSPGTRSETPGPSVR